MSRTILDTELERLNTQITRLGSLVETALRQALDAVKTNDLATCGLIVASDDAIDELRSEIEQHAFRLLTLQQPLGGRDLRYLTSAVSIVGDLERAGDGAAGIARMLIRMSSLQGQALTESEEMQAKRAAEALRSKSVLSADKTFTEASVTAGLLELGKEALDLLRRTMASFAQSDVEAARKIWEEDDIVDVRYHMVRHDLLAMLEGVHAIPALQQDNLVLQRITYLLWMAHKLERIGDHCTNICERIVFICEGVTKMPPAIAEDA